MPDWRDAISSGDGPSFLARIDAGETIGAGNRIYRVNPVEMTQDEAAGADLAPAADTTAKIPCMILFNTTAPTFADVLIVHEIDGRFVARFRKPACGIIRVTVTTGVSPPLPAAGATVTIYDGPLSTDPVLGICTTDGTGRCSIVITVAKTYAWKINKLGCTDVTGTVAAICDTNDVAVTLVCTPLASVNCGDCSNIIPATLMLSDGFGTITLTNVDTMNRWSGCAMRTASQAYASPCPASPFTRPSASVPVHFDLDCIGGGTWILTMQFPGCPGLFSKYPAVDSCAAYPWASYADPSEADGNTPSCSPFYLTLDLVTVGLGGYGAGDLIYGHPHSFTVTE